jgi:hypothetical protein
LRTVATFHTVGHPMRRTSHSLGWLWPLLLTYGGCGPLDQVLEGEEIPPVDSSAEEPDRDQHSDAGQEVEEPEDAGEVLPGGAVAKDTDCDLHGLWAARQVTLSRAIGAPQYASTWYFLELAQDGEDVIVTRHFDCGIEVKGTVSVKLTPATVRAFIAHNAQVGRKGSMHKREDQCKFSMERFWSVRGADEARFRPTGNESALDVAQVAAGNPLPTQGDTEGAIDWENDGQLGAAWQVTGIVSGTRNTVQRDWTEWFTDGTHTIEPSEDWAVDLITRVRFNNEENVLHASNATVSSGGTSDASAQHLLTLRFLGRSMQDERAKALVKAEKFDTCLAIQAALPAADDLSTP